SGISEESVDGWELTSTRELPFHQRDHAPHGCFEAPEHRVAHDAVADVELLNLRDDRDGLHVLIGEPMASMDREPELTGMLGRFAQFVQRFISTFFIRRFP